MFGDVGGVHFVISGFGSHFVRFGAGFFGIGAQIDGRLMPARIAVVVVLVGVEVEGAPKVVVADDANS